MEHKKQVVCPECGWPKEKHTVRAKRELSPQELQATRKGYRTNLNHCELMFQMERK